MRYSSSDYSDVVLKSSLISRISPESFRSLYCFIRHRIWKFSFDLCTNPRCFERARICQRVFPSYETPSYSGSHNKHNFECTLRTALRAAIKLRTCFFIFMPHVFPFFYMYPVLILSLRETATEEITNLKTARSSMGSPFWAHASSSSSLHILHPFLSIFLSVANGPWRDKWVLGQNWKKIISWAHEPIIQRGGLQAAQKMCPLHRFMSPAAIARYEFCIS